MTAITLHIDEVVLHGLGPVDRLALERALTAELERCLAGADLGPSRHLELARGVPLRGVDVDGSSDLGRELARSLVEFLENSGGGMGAGR